MTTARWLAGEEDSQDREHLTDIISYAIATVIFTCYCLLVLCIPSQRYLSVNDYYDTFEDNSNSQLGRLARQRQQRQQRKEDTRRRKFILQNVVIEKAVFQKSFLLSSSPVPLSDDKNRNFIQAQTYGDVQRRDVEIIDSEREKQQNGQQPEQSQKTRRLFIKSTSKVSNSSSFCDYDKRESSSSKSTTAITSKTNDTAATTIDIEECVFGNRSCSICLCNFTEGEDIIISRNESCNHVFHKDCIMAWLMQHSNCPYCRQNYFECSYDTSTSAASITENEGGEEGQGDADDDRSNTNRSNEQRRAFVTPPQDR
mmetsp:Transcript_40333/g.49142  ORF Transcript_40333/g.49142 Transcript_40333/m.49142 type:complete len:313 (+) Transcript_40333:3-941(+)